MPGGPLGQFAYQPAAGAGEFVGLASQHRREARVVTVLVVITVVITVGADNATAGRRGRFAVLAVLAVVAGGEKFFDQVLRLGLRVLVGERFPPFGAQLTVGGVVLVEIVERAADTA